jgi:uncharacterized cysteine cluster protein YcgN (CxxCxxCC family)
MKITIIESQFWKKKSLEEMSSEEWEALCDGCGRCCLHKLENEDTGEVFYTRVVCRLLDVQQCRCSRYAQRRELEPDCVVVTPQLAAKLDWIPKTCAYRLLAEGKDLESWHPLVSGDPGSVHRAGISVRDYAISEGEVEEDEMEDMIIEWLE